MNHRRLVGIDVDRLLDHVIQHGKMTLHESANKTKKKNQKQIHLNSSI